MDHEFNLNSEDGELDLNVGDIVALYCCKCGIVCNGRVTEIEPLEPRYFFSFTPSPSPNCVKDTINYKEDVKELQNA